MPLRAAEAFSLGGLQLRSPSLQVMPSHIPYLRVYANSAVAFWIRRTLLAVMPLSSPLIGLELLRRQWAIGTITLT